MTSFSTFGCLRNRATMTTTYEDEDSGNSDRQKCDDSGRKRKSNDVSDNQKDELAWKRKRNREAAKKCRDRKLQQSEDLKKRNEELEKENCELVKQRDVLMKKCQDYEEQIRRHKQQGCMVPHFSPPYDLNQILDPNIPPSPSLFEPRTPSSSPCASPILCTCPTSLPRSTLQVCKTDPTPATDATDRLHGHSNATTCELENSKRNNSRMMPTKITEMPAAMSPVTSQPTTNSIQGYSEHHYIRVRGEDGRPKELCLSRDDYIKVIKRIKALETVSTHQHGVQSNSEAAVYTPTPRLQQVPLTLQAKPEDPLKLSTSTSQSLNFMSQVKTPAGNYKQTEKLDSIDDGLVSYVTDKVDDHRSKLDFTLVNPNEIFIKDELVNAEYDQTGSSHPETNSAPVKQEVLVLDVATDPCVQEFPDQWMSTAQNIMNGINIQTDLDEQGLHHNLTGNIGDLTLEKNFPDDQIFTITDPEIAQMLEQTTQSNLEKHELVEYVTRQGPVADSITSPESEQCLSNIRTSFNSVPAHTSKIITNSCQTVPVLLQADESPVLIHPVMRVSTPKNIYRLTEYQQPLSNSISVMKTIKLRPRATQQMTSVPRVRAENTSQMVNRQYATPSIQSSQGGFRILTTDKDPLASLNNLQIINTSESFDFKQALHSIQPLSQNVSAQKGERMTVQQQQVPQRVPIIPIPQCFQSTDNFSTNGQVSAQLQRATTTNLETENTQQMTEYLAGNSTEILDYT